jgi:hypothetical protein
MRVAAAMVALVLAGCAHASGVRYTFMPCNPGFQDAVVACFYEPGMGPPIAAYDFYADSGIIEQQWKKQYESCMSRRGYNQIYGTTTWKPKERFNGAAGWPSCPDGPPTTPLVRCSRCGASIRPGRGNVRPALMRLSTGATQIRALATTPTTAPAHPAAISQSAMRIDESAAPAHPPSIQAPLNPSPPATPPHLAGDRSASSRARALVGPQKTKREATRWARRACRQVSIASKISRSTPRLVRMANAK